MGEDERELVADEGVDEGSADSGVEGDHDGTTPDVLGARAVGTPENGEQNAAPELVVTGEEPASPGQRQQVGEG